MCHRAIVGMKDGQQQPVQHIDQIFRKCACLCAGVAGKLCGKCQTGVSLLLCTCQTAARQVSFTVRQMSF